jgi:hypothetical protein
MRLSCHSFAAAEAFWDADQASEILALHPSGKRRCQRTDQRLSVEPLRVRLEKPAQR